MQYIVTSKEMKEYDNNTINGIGIPSLVLMERAAFSVFQVIKGLKESGKVLVLAGVGNNGADGLALCRMLMDAGYEVCICILGDIRKGTLEFHAQKDILKFYSPEYYKSSQLQLWENSKFDFVVDSIFGIGLSRDISGEYATLIQKLNEMQGIKIAVDVPSGICADTGRVLGIAFKADYTVTFAFNKAGLCLYPGTEFAGLVWVSDIGITEKAFMGKEPKMITYDGPIDQYLPARKPDGNKGTFGKVLVVAGFENMVGAAVLCAKACLTTGAGMVKVICPKENRDLLISTVLETLYGEDLKEDKDLEWADVIVVGPGLGSSSKAREIMHFLLKNGNVPLVLDADGLNFISRDDELADLLKKYKESVIMTPHVGEAARLLHISVKEAKDSYQDVAKNLAKEYHSIMVCKDARTLVYETDRPMYLNLSGNDGMATAGSGDVLAGMIAALVAQGKAPYDAACTGVYLHGLAGDYAKEKYGSYSITAAKMIENIANLYKK